MQKEKINYKITSKENPNSPLIMTIKFSIVVAAIGIVFCIILLAKNNF
ncbi:hypothetical protein [Maribacter aurantiacus]|nr:hypothetical protein [Maribacter aurantiacus]